jgi:hypothetical protein
VFPSAIVKLIEQLLQRFHFLLVFGFEDGAWCWLRPHQEALRCVISICLLLFLNRKTQTAAAQGVYDNNDDDDDDLIYLQYDSSTPLQFFAPE